MKISINDIVAISYNRNLIVSCYKNGNYKIYNEITKKITNTKSNCREILISTMINKKYK